MRELDARQFISDVIQELWPKWNPPPAEKNVWIRGLESSDWGDAKDRAEAYYADKGGRTQRPSIKDFRAVKFATTSSVCEVNTNLYVVCINHPDQRIVNQKIGVFCPARYTREQKLEATEPLRKITEDNRGGQWITQTLKDEEPVEGLIGPAAAQYVKERILSGPDCRAKEFVKSCGMNIGKDVLKGIDGAMGEAEKQKRIQQQKVKLKMFEKCTFCDRTDTLEREGEFIVCPDCCKRQPGEGE